MVDATWKSGNNWEVASLFFNLFFIGFLVFAILRSVKFEEYNFAFSLVRLFALYLLVKYFTLFFDMFDTGLFFMIGGALFITGGWYMEKNRERLTEFMKHKHEEGIE